VNPFDFGLFAEDLWTNAKELFSSIFFTSIVNAFAGAFMGAYAAQRIAERTKKRDDLVGEIRDTNAANMVSFTICNSLLALKKQHVKRLKDQYDKDRAALEEHKTKIEAGQIDPAQHPFHFTADLETLPIEKYPADVLQSHVFEKLSVSGRALSLATMVSQTVHALNAAAEKRNQLIESYKTNPIPEHVFPALYFGLPINGNVNRDYPATIEAIHLQTDAGIFFAQLLCKDLTEHAEQLTTRFVRLFPRERAPRASKPDFAKAETAGLMPSAEAFADWTQGFVRLPDPPATLWQRLRGRHQWDSRR
jgi:hypothetical protein